MLQKGSSLSVLCCYSLVEKVTCICIFRHAVFRQDQISSFNIDKIVPVPVPGSTVPGTGRCLYDYLHSKRLSIDCLASVYCDTSSFFSMAILSSYLNDFRF
jgi:hypothetical protein